MSRSPLGGTLQGVLRGWIGVLADITLREPRHERGSLSPPSPGSQGDRPTPTANRPHRPAPPLGEALLREGGYIVYTCTVSSH